MNRTLLNIIAAFVLLLLGACGGGEKKSAETPSRSDAPETGAPAAGTPAAGASANAQPGVAGERIKIKSADGKRVMEIAVGSRDVTIELGEDGKGRLILGRMSEGGRRRYATDAGNAIAEVKADDDAFKVRTADGVLLWKVKMKDDKIKISDNEENAHPYVLKSDDDGVKVKENEETEIGKVKFHADGEKIKVKDASGAELFESNTAKRSAMYGVLLMKNIPETERAIIMAEILARGR